MVKFHNLTIVGNEVTFIGNGIRIVITRSSALLLLEMLQDEYRTGNLYLDNKDIMQSLEDSE